MAYSTTPKIMNPTTGWASSDQLALIEEWAKEVPKNGIVVEVGAFVGRSAWHWAKSVDPSVTVYAIDSWDPTLYSKYRERRHLLEGTRLDPKTVECTFDDFSKNTYDCPNLIGVKARSPNIPSVILDKLHNVDLIYLDDSHVNPEFKNNIEFWIKRLKPKGVFCGDDFEGGHVAATVSLYAFLNRKQVYSRSNFWRMYDWDETIIN